MIKSVPLRIVVLFTAALLFHFPPSAQSQEDRCPFPQDWHPHPQGFPLRTLKDEPLVIGDPEVMYDNGVYKVWGTLWDPSLRELGIAHAESEDGIVWKPQVSKERHRLVIRPTPGGWDRKLETITVLKKEGKYLAWYLGYPCHLPKGESGRHKCIGFASSYNGIDWEKHPDPVLLPEAEWEEPYQQTSFEEGREIEYWDGGVQEPSVIWNEGRGLFEMWYEANSMPHGRWDQQIGHATSSDGIHWTKHPGNPVFTRRIGEYWDNQPTGHSNVVRDGKVLHLFYASGGYRTSIGHAVSRDGISWERDTANPVVASTLPVEFVRKLTAWKNKKHKGSRPKPPKKSRVFGGPGILRNPDGTLHLVNGEFRLYYWGPEEGSINFSSPPRMYLSTASCKEEETD